jgi:hypothetical protein
MCNGKPFIESHVTSYSKIHVKNPILFRMRYLCFINVNLALISTGTIMMVCLLFETLVAMDSYHFEALRGSVICSEVTVLWSICLLIFRMCPVFDTDVWGQPITPKFKGQTVKETYFMENVCL